MFHDDLGGQHGNPLDIPVSGGSPCHYSPICNPFVLLVRDIVHPGIDVHFDIAFLNDHCWKVLHGRDFKLFETVEN